MTPAKTMAAPAGLPAAAGSPGRGRALALEEFRQLAVPLAVLGIVIALITPLPSFVLDLLIVTDLLMSITVMMVSLYLVRPVEFTSFPTTLLLLTLFRLALNISSSRLILLNGNTGTTAAGKVIGAFGSFVVGGNYIIGAAVPLLMVGAAFQFFDGVQVTATGALRGVGNTHAGLVVQLIGYWVVGLPLGLWLGVA